MTAAPASRTSSALGGEAAADEGAIATIRRGLALTPELLRHGTESIMQTRDGLLRAALPRPIGTCVFANDLDADQLDDMLARHKELVRGYPRQGEGQDMFTSPAA